MPAVALSIGVYGKGVVHRLTNIHPGLPLTLIHWALVQVKMAWVGGNVEDHDSSQQN
jgi:hypothetical protein